MKIWKRKKSLNEEGNKNKITDEKMIERLEKMK